MTGLFRLDAVVEIVRGGLLKDDGWLCGAWNLNPHPWKAKGAAPACHGCFLCRRDGLIEEGFLTLRTAFGMTRGILGRETWEAPKRNPRTTGLKTRHYTDFFRNDKFFVGIVEGIRDSGRSIRLHGDRSRRDSSPRGLRLE
jgi:hypothetical protein